MGRYLLQPVGRFPQCPDVRGGPHGLRARPAVWRDWPVLSVTDLALLALVLAGDEACSSKHATDSMVDVWGIFRRHALSQGAPFLGEPRQRVIGASLRNDFGKAGTQLGQ